MPEPQGNNAPSKVLGELYLCQTRMSIRRLDTPIHPFTHSPIHSLIQEADAILKQLQQRQFQPVYFLQGEEPYYIDVVADLIEKTALAEHERSFNQVVVYGKDVDVTAILGQAKRFPMMAERSVVIVKEAQTVADLEQERSWPFLEAYLKNPLASTVLVFCYKHKTLDSRKKLGKLLSGKDVAGGADDQQEALRQPGAAVAHGQRAQPRPADYAGRPRPCWPSTSGPTWAGWPTR